MKCLDAFDRIVLAIERGLAFPLRQVPAVFVPLGVPELEGGCDGGLAERRFEHLRPFEIAQCVEEVERKALGSFTVWPSAYMSMPG